MIEFKTRRRYGKRSRWLLKYPRKSIKHRIDEKYKGWFGNNWDNYYYLTGKIDKFLMANLNRPVDKVFSEFLDRCNNSAKRYDLKKFFYSNFKDKKDISYYGGFYLTNDIINYKKGTKHKLYLT